MRILYCDLCGQPIKDNLYRLIILNYTTRLTSEYSTDLLKEKECDICETCKNILDKIFEKRMKGILKLAEDLKTIYETDSKEKR